jgi:hypothetical protein
VKWLLPTAEVVSTSLFEAGNWSVPGRNGTTATFSLERVLLDEAPWPFATGSFDVVLIWEVLEHLFHDPAFAMFEARRVLASNGLLQLTTPNPGSCRTLAALLAGEQTADFVAINGWGVAHPHEMGLAYMRRLVEGSGFSVAAHGSWQDDLGPGRCSLKWEDPTCRQLPQRILAAIDAGPWRGMQRRTRQFLTARASQPLGGQTRFPANLHCNPSMFPMDATVGSGGALPWRGFADSAAWIQEDSNGHGRHRARALTQPRNRTQPSLVTASY